MKISNLRYGYDESTTLIENLNIDFLNGNCYLLFGENGAGKSTLAKIISNNIKNYSGNISFSKNQSFETIGYQVQDFYSFPNLKVKEVLNFWEGIYTLKLKDKGLLLKNLNIEKILNKKIKNLSGGEARSLSIFLVLSLDKNIFILDEPFSGLDFKKKQFLRNYIKKLVSRDTLIIIISHELQGYEDMFDKIAIFQNKKIENILDNNVINDKQNLTSIINQKIKES